MRRNLRRLLVAGLLACLLLAGVLFFSSRSQTEALHLAMAAPRDVVINEIAWMGTTAEATDEWIELYNTTDQEIDLTGWSLRADDNTPDITLSGLIPAHGYFLLERTADTTVSDIPADQIYTGALQNNPDAEALRLKDDTDQIIDTANLDGGAWPAGDNSSKSTMERIDPWAPDTDANWATNDGVTRNGHDAGTPPNPINGTPKAWNSASGERPVLPADLQVAKSGPISATPGSLITYQLSITNTGGITATSLRLTDTLPSEMAFVASSVPTSSQVGRHFVWLLSDLGNGESHALTLTARITESASGTLVNVITATTAATETFTSNNSATYTTTLGAPPEPPTVLINAAIYDGYPIHGPGEAVQLVNIGGSTAQMTGWELCKYAIPLECVPLPTLTLPPSETLWLAADAIKFETFFGFPPDAEPSDWLALTNGGAEVILRNDRGEVLDVLVYEGGQTTIEGWSGPSVTNYGIGLNSKYQILARIPDETTGLPITDTDSVADWMQSTGDPQEGRRAVYPGWDYVASPMTPLFWPLRVTEPATVVVGIAPDNAFQIISSTLLQARRAISIEVYSLRHPAIIEILEMKAQAGVSVTLLLEGSPLGVSDEDWEQELNACEMIEAAGGRCYFMISHTDDDRFNRYAYLHSKLIIVDDRWAVISSQNLSNSSLPADDKSDGTLGSRGTLIATTAPSVVKRAQEIFAMDCDPAHHRDIFRWNTASGDPDYAKWGEPTLAYTSTIPNGISDTVRFTEPLVLSGTFDFELFTAPEAALRQSDALLGLLSRAGSGDRVYVEQLDESPDWGDDPATDPNLRLEAYLDAARRGASVRVLVDSTSYTVTHRNDYTQTVNYLNGVAAAEGLDLQAGGGSPTTYGIHNKMVLVWLEGEGGYVHVGSINGSEGSNKANREIALQIQSDAAFEYLERMFLVDWHLSHPVFLPLVMRNYEPPVQYVVISEVYYKSSPAGEWVEIYNPTARPIDLSNYKIGDAERPDKFEGMVKFPPGTTIPGQGILVVAYRGDEVPEADFEIYDFNPAIPEMVPYPGWGDPEADWGLNNQGDQVLLLGPNDNRVDVVVWGTAAYPGVVPHPGADKFSHSLQRYPPGYDTNNCALDFRSFPTTLGEVLFP